MSLSKESEPRKPDEIIKINPTIMFPFTVGVFESIRALNQHREATAKAAEQKKTA